MWRMLQPTFEPVLQQISNIAIQLILQQSHKVSCTFFAARFTVP